MHNFYELKWFSEEFHVEPNADTIEALKESREKNLVSYETLGNFWQAMGIEPNLDNDMLSN